MRFMVMHKHDKHTEAGLRPGPELLQQMGDFIGEHARKGTFLGGEGLGASATRTRLTFRGGQATIKHGPYTGSNELPAAALLLTVESRDQALGWAQRYGKILGDGEIEVGAVTEPWDLGFMPKPESAPQRYLMLPKADEAAALTSKQKGDISRLKTEMTKAGVLKAAHTLAPSAKSKRLQFTNFNLKVLDGPFSESKELIGGFAILDLPSAEVTIEECKRYAQILGGTLEIDLRPIEEESADS